MCTGLSFKEATLKTCQAKRVAMKRDKTTQKAAKQIEKEAKSILDDHPPPKLLGSHYQTPLLYHGLPRKNHMGKQLVRQKPSS